MKNLDENIQNPDYDSAEEEMSDNSDKENINSR